MWKNELRLEARDLITNVTERQEIAHVLRFIRIACMSFLKSIESSNNIPKETWGDYFILCERELILWAAVLDGKLEQQDVKREMATRMFEIEEAYLDILKHAHLPQSSDAFIAMAMAQNELWLHLTDSHIESDDLLIIMNFTRTESPAYQGIHPEAESAFVFAHWIHRFTHVALRAELNCRIRKAILDMIDLLNYLYKEKLNLLALH